MQNDSTYRESVYSDHVLETDKRLTDMDGMVHRRTKHHGFSIPGLFFPMPDDSIGDRGFVENFIHLLHIKIVDGFSNIAQSILGAHIQNKGARRNQLTGLD